MKKPLTKFSGKFYSLDVMKLDKYKKLVDNYRINYIDHLAAILSGLG